MLARVPAGWNHPAEKDSRRINMLEHVLVAKPLRTLAGHALNGVGEGECGNSLNSALDHVDGEAADRSFFVSVAHVDAGLAHGLDAIVGRHEMLAVMEGKVSTEGQDSSTAGLVAYLKNLGR